MDVQGGSMNAGAAIIQWRSYSPPTTAGDHLHPDSAGMQAMANTVNLPLLTS